MAIIPYCLQNNKKKGLYMFNTDATTSRPFLFLNILDLWLVKSADVKPVDIEPMDT